MWRRGEDMAHNASGTQVPSVSVVFFVVDWLIDCFFLCLFGWLVDIFHIC
jgi:hypothetical protein